MSGVNKPYQVIISERAVEILMQHVRFLAKVSLSAAENLRQEILEASQSLQHLPERNSWLSDPLLAEHKYRKMLICKRYLIIYQIKGNTVFIDYILDCRRDYQWLL